MAPPRFLPPDHVLTQWRAEGLTHKQMADRVKDQTGVEVAVGTVSAALSRAGLTERIRYAEVIPWSVKSEHETYYPYVMLSAEGRARRGKPLSPAKAVKLANWKNRLAAEGVVVHYERSTDYGWHYVPARPGIDLGLIREVA